MLKLNACRQTSSATARGLDYAAALKTCPVVIVESHDRKLSCDKEMKEVLRKAGDSQVTETYIEAGHSYSDRGIALQAAIVQWLATLFPLAPK